MKDSLNPADAQFIRVLSKRLWRCKLAEGGLPAEDAMLGGRGSGGEGDEKGVVEREGVTEGLAVTKRAFRKETRSFRAGDGCLDDVLRGRCRGARLGDSCRKP